MNRIEAFFKVVIDGEAWLYANQLKDKRMGFEDVSEAQFKTWEDEWKKQTEDLVRELTTDVPEVQEDS